MSCLAWNWGEANFWLDLVIILSTAPYAYLTWASGLIGSLLEMAKANHRWPSRWPWSPRIREWWKQ